MTRATAPDPADAPETSVPADAAAVECPHCGRPFPEERPRDLHRWLAHREALTGDERAAARRARRAEAEALRLLKLRALGALVVVYFGLLFAFSVFG